MPCHSGPFTAWLARSRAAAMESMGADPAAMALKTPPRMPPRSKTMSFRVPKVLAAAWIAASISPDAVLACTQFWKE